MSAVGHYLEQRGIPTVQISLVREHTEALRPPRALWVPFMLGRPFGVPHDPSFQRDVLLGALRLLEHSGAPILEDFTRDAPHDDLGESDEGLTCAVSFPRATSDGSLAERLADEASQLQAWHDVMSAHRRRSTLGVTGVTPHDLGSLLVGWLDGSPIPEFHAGLTQAHALKLVADELKAFYFESKAAQPGRHSARDIDRWFWFETAAGELLLAVRDRGLLSDAPSMVALAKLSIVPRAIDAALSEGHSAGKS